MARKIGVSRHGLTRCPQCGQHIKVSAQIAATVCPFCSASLLAAPTSRGPLAAARSLLTTRGGLLAAALLGPAALPSCESSSTSGKPDTTQSADTIDTEDAQVQPLYGLPSDVLPTPDDVVETETVEDAGAQPEYGLPADIDITPIEDASPQPEYGLPADIDIEPIEDASPQPEYGLPADVEASPDIQDQPMYGLPAGVDATPASPNPKTP